MRSYVSSISPGRLRIPYLTKNDFESLSILPLPPQGQESRQASSVVDQIQGILPRLYSSLWKVGCSLVPSGCQVEGLWWLLTVPSVADKACMQSGGGVSLREGRPKWGRNQGSALLWEGQWLVEPQAWAEGSSAGCLGMGQSFLTSCLALKTSKPRWPPSPAACSSCPR